MSIKKTLSRYSFRVLQNEDKFEPTPISKSIFASRSFLKETVDANPQIDHKILEVKEDKEVLAYFYYQIMPFKGSELKSYIPNGENCIVNKTVEALLDMALERVNWSLAVLGNVFITGDNGQFWVKNLTAKDKWRIVEEATSFLTEKIKIDAFLISDLRAEDLEKHDKMIENNYRFFEVEPDLVFDIDPTWQSFDDYLGSVVSKYRVRTKKVLEKSQDVIIKDLDAETIKNNEAEIYQLYKNVVESATFKLAEISQNYFYDFKVAYPSDFYVRGYYINEKLIGIISFFTDHACLHINFVGLDYEKNKEYSIYQRILYDCIEQGIAHQKSRIHFGRTASEIKTSVGAYPIKAFSLLKHNSKIPNLAIKPLTSYLKPEPFEVRNPFKNKKVS